MATDNKAKKTSTTKKSTPSKTTTKKSSTVNSGVKKPAVKRKTTSKTGTTKPVAKKQSTTKTTVKKPATTSKKKTTTPKKRVASSKSKAVSKKNIEKPKIVEIHKQVTSENFDEKEKKGKLFYLILLLGFYVAAFFYINNIMYDNEDYLKSALFAFAALFVFLVLIQFNIHMIFINFFRLPFKYLLDETKLEIKKESNLDEKATKSRLPFRRYKAFFTLTLYIIIILLLVGSQVYNGIMDDDKVLVIITQSSLTLLVFLIIVCSWQYMFNILPEVLDKSIDAKNGFILTLSASVMIIYVIFNIFKITYLAEMMIFILIVGFIALLGVNLNMIVGEINIFQNLKQRHSETVTKVVFMIFFAFHLYVILYASVVAYSIYRWEEDAYNFSYSEYEYEEITDLYDSVNDPIGEIYYPAGVLLTDVYDVNGDIITEYVDEDGYPIEEIYDNEGFRIREYYNVLNHPYNNDWSPVYDNFGNTVDVFYFNGSTLSGIDIIEKTHDYGDFLYYTVVTVSTLGYGDITPSTDYGIAQGWGGFLSIYGFTFFALSISFVSNIAIEGATSIREEDSDD